MRPTALLRRALLVLALSLPTTAVRAQAAPVAADYPARPLRLVVSVAPGGLTDILARLLAERLQARLGQPVIVENKTGAGGIVAMDFVAKSPADGYTLVMGYPGALAVNQALYKTLPYDPAKSFAPVSLVAAWPLVLVTHPSVPAKTVKELVDLARAQPGRLSYASGGNATTGHLAMELFRSQTGTDMVHVPYRGAAPAMTDLLAGLVQLEFDSLALVMPQVQAGKLRALAISTRQRSPLAPHLPTVAESGLPQFDVSGWYGVLAPAGTPAPIVAKLSRELVAIVNESAVREQLASRGVEPLGQDAEAFARFIKSETEKWGRLVVERHLKVDQ